MNEKCGLPWTQPGWRAEVTAWIHEALGRRGIRVTGPIRQPHVRPWSTVLRVPTGEGTVFFKASAPVCAHEPAATLALACWRPDCLPRVLATDIECGWVLLADGGARLREILRADRDPAHLRHWEKPLPALAELEVALSGRLAHLLALGTPDRRLAGLPAQYETLVGDTDALHIGPAEGLTPDERARLCGLAPRFARMCERLAGYGLPESLLHGDLRDGNIFVEGDRYVFFDWGDSVVTHPFLGLRSAFASIEKSLDIAGDAPERDRLRDAYLEPWTRFAARDDLRDALALARRVAPINGALTRRRAVSRLAAGPLRDGYARPAPALLREFLESEERGGRPSRNAPVSRPPRSLRAWRVSNRTWR